MLQCKRKFWLEIFHPELQKDDHKTVLKYQTGNQVGEIARSIFDPKSLGYFLDIKILGIEGAIQKSQLLLKGGKPVFEAGLSGGGVMAFADVMLPGEKLASWEMIEVKSSTTVKDHHRDDIAIQTYAAVSAGVDIERVSVASINNTWVYPGNGNYKGLLKLTDLTSETISRLNEVAEWIKQAKFIAKESYQPTDSIGAHCTSPFECGYIQHCSRDTEPTEYPITWLPNLSKKKKIALEKAGVIDLRDASDDQLTDIQIRVKNAHKTGQPFFDAQGSAQDLSKYTLPCMFLDFETLQFGVPIWKKTKPYQQICFQFSLHKVEKDMSLSHKEFINLSGNNPSEAFAHALIEACGDERITIFVYNASFEKTRILELAEEFPLMSEKIIKIKDRIVDLMPIIKNRYYHPDQNGSWSIKKLLPVMEPGSQYDDLKGVKNGNMAASAYLESIESGISDNRKKELEKQLLMYCKLDTYSLVVLWQKLSMRVISEM